VGDGLARIYADGQKKFTKAHDKPSVKNLHEWRKQVKYLWYQILLLRKLWPKQLKRFADQIEKLVDYLSDDHDLAILRERVLKDSKQAGDGHEHEALMALIDKRRAELQTQASFLGQRIYAEDTKAINERFHDYWKAWRSEQKTNPVAAR
jgi:CHAD domain-containing protein